MCELCGGYFIGAANTTNATKHLKCRHKEEFAEYIELYDSAKRGSFVGALHDVLREIMLKGRAKRLGISNALSLQPAFALSKGECKDVQKFEKSRCEWQTSALKSHASSSKDSSSVPSSSAANGGSDSKVYVQQHSAVTVCQSQNAAVPLSDCSYAEQAIKKSRLNESANGSNESPNKVLADQMESFLKSFRQLEDECQDLRCQLSAKDEQITSLKLQLIHEKKKRESALFLIQQSLMDSGSTD
ncbi:unnamed protein product [Anisakis simplex]|uniref:BED-type domain-containing protein n=1 Tax=Anisakis simplex TaxID=6269 RepID=A0A0M3KEP2_ANISI|nr:unnamed protein product [Anisakis simplex]